MSKHYAVILLVLACCAVAAEIMAVIFSRRLTAMLSLKSGMVRPGPLEIAMTIISLPYIGAIVMLVCSPDNVFRTYGAVLVCLSLAMMGMRRFILRYPLLLSLESSICLIMLIDVIRTLLKVWPSAAA